ncbi:hypothetical protein [Mesorhizobium sp.]|uniref:hypothetical protein n=1 Tax=Mesorhizobium sp. TaxID=1871066 RepID=UPI0025C67C7F|nr:hypothetical protein [Mesorhizobium sp.]
MTLNAYRAARNGAIGQGTLAAAACLSTLLCSQALAQENTVELNPINVEGQIDSPVGPDDGYIAKNTTTGSKTDTPLKEIPQSVSVVTRKQLDAVSPGNSRTRCPILPASPRRRGASTSASTSV